MGVKCLSCPAVATEKHHIIFRSQGGTDHPFNIAGLCFDCHYNIHHGTDTERRNQILKFCHAQACQDLSKCWTGKIKPKVVRVLENSMAGK